MAVSKKKTSKENKFSRPKKKKEPKVVKKKTTKKKTAKKKTPTLKAKARQKLKGIKTRAACLAARIENPGKTHAELADMLGIARCVVTKSLAAQVCRDTMKRIEEGEEAFLYGTRVKALALLDSVIESPDEDMSLRVNTAKFVLKPVIEKEAEVPADTLIFETVISETGAVSRDVRRLFEGDVIDVTPESN